jgi:hypothetical protein
MHASMLRWMNTLMLVSITMLLSPTLRLTPTAILTSDVLASMAPCAAPLTSPTPVVTMILLRYL